MPSGKTIVTTAEGVAISFSGIVGKFGAAHPRALATISAVMGFLLGWGIAHF